jgi:hypothetical protein
VSEKVEDVSSRQRLSALREGLLDLHKALIDSERIGYEQTFGNIGSPNDFLRLLLEDPWFQWLRPLSAFISRLDETLDDREVPVTEKIASNLVAEISTLLTPSEGGEGFGRHYFEALQREPSVIMAHAAVNRLKSAPH